MPKQKTKTIVAKRFKITKTGKVIHRVKGKRHLRRNKSAARKRRQDKPKVLTNARFVRVVKTFLSV